MNDGLPQEMCSSCVATVNKITTFQKICDAANKTLLDLIDTKASQIKNEPECTSTCYRDNVIGIDISDSSCDDDSREGGCGSPLSSAQKCLSQDTLQGVSQQSGDGHSQPAKTGYSCPDVGSSHSNSPQLNVPSEPPDKTVRNSDINNSYKEYETTVEDLLQRRTHIEFENLKFTPKIKKEVIISKKEKQIKRQVKRIEATKKEQLNSYECEFCHKKYTSKHSYESHLKIHTGTKLICQHCGKQFLTSRRLLFHCKSRHGYEKTDKCPHCEWTGVSADALKAHIRLHTGEKPYVCEVCSAAFARGSSYRQHRATHLPEKTVPCDLCPAMFKSYTLMRIHRTRHRPRSSRHRCRRCDASFSSRWHCVRHVRRIHGVEDVDACVEKIKINNIES
ncbi:unnamed protein product [Plutella xylostella]|uniref:(diamondback moth) hypothetical protein n=1 Tax=Plutella xylostella TaxID=51655 RepID=A0A8S4FVY9_PLUXY|nr:unnamed protein product [Plutella xylostella]